MNYSETVQIIFNTFEISFFAVLLALFYSLIFFRIILFKKLKYGLIIEFIFSIPVLLPPTVLGFYWLFFFHQNTFLVFSKLSLIIAGSVICFPLIMKNLHAFGRRGLKNYIEVGLAHGLTFNQTFFKIVLPLSKNIFLSNLCFGISYLFGQFGVFYLIGGSILGKTKVLSIAIFESIETLNFKEGHFLSLINIFICAFFYFIYFILQRKNES